MNTHIRTYWATHPRPILRRANMWDLVDPLSGVRFRLQFYTTGQHDRHGKNRMAVVIFEAQGDTDIFTLALKTSVFIPPSRYVCDGPEAAKLACMLIPHRDYVWIEGLVPTPTSHTAEGRWLAAKNPTP